MNVSATAQNSASIPPWLPLAVVGLLVLISLMGWLLWWLNTYRNKWLNGKMTALKLQNKVLETRLSARGTDRRSAREIAEEITANVQEYRYALAKTAGIEECEKLPVPKFRQGQNYVFISYSHSDYKQVYGDIANLYYSGVRFWYDRGLVAGTNWKDEVLKHLADPCCAGVIFYLSENLFLSQSILTEIKATVNKKPYFAVNLTDALPSDILKNSIPYMRSAEDTMEWVHCLSGTFKDSVTYLPFRAADHDKVLIEQINEQFHVAADTPPGA